MLRPAFLLAAVLSSALLSPPRAFAESDMVVGRPPSLLSPDLTEPWIVQMKPGARQPYISDPVPRRVAFAPSFGFWHRPAAQGYAAQGYTDPAYLPRLVAYTGSEAPGTIVIDTNQRYLLLVLPSGLAKRYGVGVGRPGFEWSGAHTVTRKAEWPDWTPPPEMVKRQPWLPASMKGGPGNPLGARAIYLGDTEYRIHGTSEPWTIGHAVSSGCIRMRNEDVIDLYDHVRVGTRVVVI
jgi:lipoprotein-anchoring transpeptidase ErfK/SrfK